MHVAGTKGKGYVTQAVEALLAQNQKLTGKYEKLGCLMSPHVSDVRERIRLDSKMISEELFADYVFEVYNKTQERKARGANEPADLGYTGFIQVLAFYIFVKEGVEKVVLEVGVGGELDSTNVIERPIATGVTTIGRDHEKALGSDLKDIAWHKSGIFKEGAPAFTVEQNPTVLKVLQERAYQLGASKFQVVSKDLVGQFGICVTPNLPYQRQNCSLAIMLAAACIQATDPGFHMTAEIVRVLEHLRLPGRNETRQEGQRIWFIDTAHNELGIKEASTWFKERLGQAW